ncbi:protein pelota [Nematocida homosporus]|uniref:protein pelota n=1 Tax=Nematocida homosporus TaxID=1912981 RepID=UPI0022209D35|nr:protein pelota [Nematocida homosporus]KAI5184294.1 protein pelota [Nematocida homosporus]
MKILSKSSTKQETFLDIIPEDIDDIYALYRVLEKKDRVKTTTSRSISADENKSKSRITLLLEVEVDHISVDLAVGILFIKGKILNETKYTKVGTFHTLDIPVHQRFSIVKENISAGTLTMLKDLTIENKAETAYLLCRKDTYALILSSQYTTKRIKTYPKEKNKGSKDKTIAQIVKEIKEGVKLFIIVSDDKDVPEHFKKIPELKGRIFFCKRPVVTENTYKGDSEAISALLKLPDVLKQISAQRYGKEILATTEFFNQEEKGTKGTTSGQKETLCAAENYLIKKLIIVDSVIKSEKPEEREIVAQIMGLAKQANAETFILSQHTPLGEKVLARGGVLSLLSQPVNIADLM